MQNVNNSMEQKPKSIKTIGLLICLFAIFLILINGIGVLSWLSIYEELDSTETKWNDPISFYFSYFIEIGLVMMIVGIIYLIGGIFIRKYRLWANQLVSGFSILLILFHLIGLISLKQPEGMNDLVISALSIYSLFWLIPLGLFIWFLNRKKIKKHFA
jgi:hypothetical protein